MVILTALAVAMMAMEACVDHDLTLRTVHADLIFVGGGGDRMSGLGAGLNNIDWGRTTLAKFEKK